MRRKVRIVSLPKAGSGMEVNSTQSLNPGLGYSLSQSATMNRFAKPDTKVNRTLKAVPREEANLEAEKGETAYTDLNGDGIPEHYKMAKDIMMVVHLCIFQITLLSFLEIEL